jgi:DNA-binding NarL/FixJ family response regulator
MSRASQVIFWFNFPGALSKAYGESCMYVRGEMQFVQNQGEGGQGGSVPDFTLLTPRERQVLVLLPDGETNRVLAGRLGVAERTVKAHITSLMRKLGLRSRVEAAVLASRHHYAICPLGHSPKVQ